MATPAQISEVRRLTNQPANTEPFTDDVLSAMIDAGTINSTASAVWQAKAAQVAHLVDISEGGSSRKMSDLYKNYLALADSFTADAVAAVSAPRSTRTRGIVRL